MPYKAYKFRLEPSISQRNQLGAIAGSCRFIFNHFLAAQKELYTKRKETGDTSIKFLSYHQSSTLLTSLKQQEETSWLQEAPSQSLQQSLIDLDKATKGWLTKKTGFPRFKKKGVRDSFRIPTPPQVDSANRTIKLPKLGIIRYRKSREIIGAIKSATISRDGHHWFISILVEQPNSSTLHPSSSAVGIDLGVTHFATLSTGEHLDMPASLKKLVQRVASLQQRLAHKQRGSNNSQKARRRLSAAHRHIRNIRLDFIHKASTYIAKNHSSVVMEDLKVTNMMKSASGTKEQPGRNVRAKSGLNRSIAQQAWNLFRIILAYKLQDLNGELIVVDPRYTSQTCSKCMVTDRRSRKSQAVFRCTNCGHTVNADVNAATNILSLYQLGKVVAA